MKENYNTVFIPSSSRTGSMWTTNVIREIFDLKKYNVLPIKQYQNDTEWIELYDRQAIKDINIQNKYVIKLHMPIKLNAPGALYVVNI